MTIPRGLLALAFCLAAVLPARAAEFSPDQATEIRAIIKSYLIEHPEVLRDAISALDDKEKTAEADSRKKALADLSGPIYNAPDGLVIGNPAGAGTESARWTTSAAS